MKTGVKIIHASSCYGKVPITRKGFRGLFKGNGTNCARIVSNSAVKFFSYEQASK
ncbi:hypothetical protein JHK85_001055 [Glycine max]|nr:hypothetical protein JHK85_001055 [Glycine max]